MTTATATKAIADKAAFDATGVGDVFVSSWGWDQTNVDFYKVVAKTGARVKVVKIGKIAVSDDDHRSSVSVIPNKTVTEGPVMTKAIRAGYGGEAYFKVETYAYARRWDGTPKHETSYWAGH